MGKKILAVVNFILSAMGGAGDASFGSDARFDQSLVKFKLIDIKNKKCIFGKYMIQNSIISGDEISEILINEIYAILKLN